MSDSLNRILIMSPHPDDGEVSAGGTIARFVDEGKEIYYSAFSNCEKSLPENCTKDTLKEECLAATKELGIPKSNVCLFDFEVREFPRLRQEILDCMIKIGREIQPDLVIAPSSFDTHQDHNIIYGESIRAFKKMSSIWGMEHPWNNLSFRTDIFIELEKEYIEKKISALKMYNSQSFRNYFAEEYIISCAYTRGMMINKKYAEVFECIRDIKTI
jgi:N-acetylglucosamine malate deacetylase 1